MKDQNVQNQVNSWEVWEVEYCMDASGESDIILIEFVEKFNTWQEANEYAINLTSFTKKFKAFQA